MSRCGSTIRTCGSVGLDGLLSLLAEMPVPPKLIANTPVAGALKDKSIQLPIGGTLDKPVLDAKALANTTAQIMREAAGGTLGRELNKTFDRLFGKP